MSNCNCFYCFPPQRLVLFILMAYTRCWEGKLKIYNWNHILHSLLILCIFVYFFIFLRIDLLSVFGITKKSVWGCVKPVIQAGRDTRVLGWVVTSGVTWPFLKPPARNPSRGTARRRTRSEAFNVPLRRTVPEGPFPSGSKTACEAKWLWEDAVPPTEGKENLGKTRPVLGFTWGDWGHHSSDSTLPHRIQ